MEYTVAKELRFGVLVCLEATLKETNVQKSSCNNALSQKWDLVAGSDQIRNEKVKQCLTLRVETHELYLANCDVTDEKQKWKFVRNDQTS